MGDDLLMKTFIQQKQCDVTLLDDELIILDTQYHTITKLNHVGGFCWSLLSEPVTIDLLVDAVRKKYDIEDSQLKVQQDLERFLSELIKCGLVKHAS
ncbi:PqqD family protein [Bacillus sp. NEB1478]|uniref:PqqD family protein n=1 Tax=Bacillus sp. NEB1478 TaxID=3073816 RepID=UPI002872C66E|nr:PqqD family protein [Bacillus sp. NEB1478]WNB92476.1 PqqD family protein [Bacillus sp. NEB1478]